MGCIVCLSHSSYYDVREFDADSVLPMMENEIGISPFQSSMIITIYSIVAIILIPIAGFLSNHIGRKKVIL